MTLISWILHRVSMSGRESFHYRNSMMASPLLWHNFMFHIFR